MSKLPIPVDSKDGGTMSRSAEGLRNCTRAVARERIAAVHRQLEDGSENGGNTFVSEVPDPVLSPLLSAEPTEAHFTLGLLHAMRGDAFAAMSAYCLGSAACGSCSLMRRQLAALCGLCEGRTAPDLLHALRDILQVALVLRFPSDTADLREKLHARHQTCEAVRPDRDVAIFAGGADSLPVHVRDVYARILPTAFADWSGVLISGGTCSGVPGLVGELSARLRDRRTWVSVGYHPRSLPQHVDADARYDRLRAVGAHSVFSPLDPLSYWMDIAASGPTVDRVFLIGIGGGRISAIEYRLAAAFGAHIAVDPDSGGAAAAVFTGEAGWLAGRVRRLRATAAAIDDFLQG